VILYLDTSALVKLYVEEASSDLVREAVQRAVAVATHAIAYPEMRATLARLRREQRLSQAGLDEAKDALERDWSAFLRIEAREPMLRRAGHLAEAFALRGYDSVHLAAAEYVQLQAGERIVFHCFDERLNRAASGLGLELLPGPVSR